MKLGNVLGLVLVLLLSACGSSGPTTKCLEVYDPDTGTWQSTPYTVTIDDRPGQKKITINGPGGASYSGNYQVSGSTRQLTNGTSSNGGDIGGSVTAYDDGTFDLSISAGQAGQHSGWPIDGKWRAVDCP